MQSCEGMATAAPACGVPAGAHAVMLAYACGSAPATTEGPSLGLTGLTALGTPGSSALMLRTPAPARIFNTPHDLQARLSWVTSG